jgi:hypothetical protein
MYRAPTGGAIEVISFARRLPRPAAGTAGRIEVGVPGRPEGPGRVVIRVWTLAADVYYRLDAVASAGTTIAWPTSDVLDQEGLTSKDLGFVGWRVVGKEREFVPLGVKETASGNPAGSPVLVVRSPLPLEWVKWRLYRPGEKGSKWNDVPGTNFPAGSPVDIRMPLDAKGPYIADVYAMPRNQDMPETLTLRLLL